MSVREDKITLNCSSVQKAELLARAAAEGLSLQNFIRSRLDLPLERHGQRKDLVSTMPPANKGLQRSADSVSVKKSPSSKLKASRRAR